MDPQWLAWARALQAIAQTGLNYTEGPYDQVRYRQIMDIVAEMVARGADTPLEVVRGLFDQQYGPHTPRVDVRGVVFKDDALLLVQEVSDGHRWTLPGGWADVNETPAESAVREVYEETGYQTRAVRLLALLDKARHDHPPDLFYIYKVYFLCELTGGAPQTSLETGEARFFREDELPPNLSLGRVTLPLLKRMFEHHRDPSLLTDFD